MTRRAHQHVAGAKLAVLLAGIGLLGVGGFLSYRFTGGQYRTVETLDPESYYESANNLKGNTYRVEGWIGNSLGWNPSKGRLFSIVTQHQNKDYVLPIFVPHDIQTINIQKKQKYMVKVMVNDQGILSVLEMTKP